MQSYGGQKSTPKEKLGVRSKDCHGCRHVHWGVGLGVGIACVHPNNQKYNPKRQKEGEERTYWNSTTQVFNIPDGCQLREERIKNDS